MQRRRFTAIVGAGVTTAVAGCSSDSPESEADGDSESTDANNQDQQSDSTNGESSQDDGASFAVVEYDLPETVSIGSTVTGTVLVKNVGDSSGGFNKPLYVRTPDSDWTQVEDYSVQDVPSGGGANLSVKIDGGLTYINRYEFALGQSEKTAVIQTVSASLDWGTEYTTPEGYRIRVDEPDLQSTYTYEPYGGGAEEKSPEDRGQWAFVNVYVKNETGQTEFSPLSDEFALVTGNSQFDSTFLIDNPVNKGEQFEGGELQPGIERSGWIVYELPGDLSTSDLTMAWSNTTYGGEISVNWE